ncbi:hypothetical protein [Polaribacter sp. M15]
MIIPYQSYLYILIFLSKLSVIENKTDLVRNNLHVISYQCKEDTIEFSFDLIGDKSNDIHGKWPKVDYYQIWVDFNNNQKVDSLIDRFFSPFSKKNTYEVCKSIMFSNNSSSTCYFNSGATCEKSFGISENSKENHVMFKMTIPKKELSNSGIYNVYFEIIDGNGIRCSYPINNQIFKKTFEITCKPNSLSL